MPNTRIPFTITNWTDLPQTEFKGERGKAYWQTIEFPGIRLRIVEYTCNYLADHWCAKGHIAYCIEGEINIELANGKIFILRKGMSFSVEDFSGVHRFYSEKGARLFMIDGDFLDFSLKANEHDKRWDTADLLDYVEVKYFCCR